METVDQIIQHLGLKPHPEGGHYAETYRSAHGPQERAACTAIHYLLKRGEHSHWHRVDAEEVWCFHDGEPLELRISDGETTQTHRLTNSPLDGKPQVVVPPGAWQAARPLGEFALVSCIVAPGFEFDGFEMAAADWQPQDGG